tara:strand:- start:205 stop:1113 length:909 start_codon:yes stop_codon:yes gene_type:complete
VNNTILFGNGINRLNDNNISWDKLLNSLMGNRKFSSGDLPNTMVYERIVLESPPILGDLTRDEEKTKVKIAKLLRKMSNHDLYNEIYKLNIDHYLTTNYDFGFLNTIKSNHEISIENESTEKIYSIRRKKVLTNSNSKKYLWHIHGEIERPPSIMLGLDHYSGSVGKINNYIKGSYNHIINGKEIIEPTIFSKHQNNNFKNTSWIDQFFNANVHIIGLTLDYSEIDLWWVLNKRARMLRDPKWKNKLNNKVVFYTHNIDDARKGVLIALGVEVQEIVVNGNDKAKYLEFYEKFLTLFKKDYN